MNESIVLIQNSNNKSGTGFVIHSDEGGSYILTCHHVLGNFGEAKIDEYKIDIIVKNEIYDLALLYVHGLYKQPLKLKELEKHTNLNREVSIIGYRQFKHKEFRQDERKSKILDKGEHKYDTTSFNVWEIMAEKNHEIRRGYSGSPLILDNHVIGVVTSRETAERGFATAIQCLAEVWKEMPSDLILQDAVTHNPFVGLSAFTKENKEFFFGRDKETSEIVNKLKKNGFLAVVGDSGSGKSSIIKAGVIPNYLKQNYGVLEIRPGNNPFIELSNRLKKVVKIDDYETILRYLHVYCKEKQTILLLYIDQFEELFTTTKKEYRESFIRTLLYINENQSSQLKIEIVFTMRSDYYPLLRQYNAFSNLIEQEMEENKYVVQRMKNSQLKETIYKPLTKANIVDKNTAQVFSSRVVDEHMGSKSNEITLLQIALTQTCNKLNSSLDIFHAYQKVGGVSGALQKLADNTMKTIHNEKLMKVIFLRLIHYSQQGNHTRRVAKKSEFSEEQWKLVELLSSTLDCQGKKSIRNDESLGRLLKVTESSDDKIQSVELVHEALILGWKRYYAWIQEIQFFKAIHDEIMYKSEAYYMADKNENYLLMGNDLTKGSNLLSDSYKDFLSYDELRYIKESQLYQAKKEDEKQRMIDDLRSKELENIQTIYDLEVEKNEHQQTIQNLKIEERKSQKLIRGLMAFIIVVIGLMGVSWYLKVEAENSKDKAIQASNMLIKNLENTIKNVEVLSGFEGDYTNLHLTLRMIVLDKFSNSKNPKIIELLLRRWYVEARLFRKAKKYDYALQYYNKIINYRHENIDLNFLSFKVKALYSKASIFDENNKSKEAIEIYNMIVRDNKIQRNKNLKKYIAKSYSRLAWFQLFEKDFKESISLSLKGLSLLPNEVWMELNLAHAYLASNHIKEALEIYNKHSNQLSVIKDDLLELKNQGVLMFDIKAILREIKL